ncbi:MAG: hypothetical protein AAF682_14525 [Planctomycetota bacterium]
MPSPLALDRALRRVAPLCALALLALSAGAAQRQAPREVADSKLQPLIHTAIDRGIEHLLARQHRDGSWTGAAFGSYRTGPTAFSAYALVESGVSPDALSIRLALDYLERTPATMVYSAGAILLLLGEIGDERHEDLAQRCLDQLLAWESSGVRGTWSYPSGPVDLSNMQFVALGFWGAQRLGLDVPHDVVQRLVKATIERFQEEPFDGPARPSEKGRKRDDRIAGFHYFLERDSRPPSASMTAAGIGIQRIARELSGKKLGRKLLKAMDESEALGVRWLGAHWSVTENHGHHEGTEGQVLYLLWAIERLGALFDSDTIDGHLWYEPGARTVLAQQKDDGGWGRLHGTSYALLFLGRASRARTTGAASRPPSDAWALDHGPVRIHANGRMEIVAWITALEQERPFYVERVRWSVDGEVLADLTPESTATPWKGERFPFKWPATSIGAHTLSATVDVRAQDGTLAELVAEPLAFECRPSADEWLARAAEGSGENLLHGLEVEAQASSEAAGQYPARAVDGYEGTQWISGGEPAPRIELSFPEPVRAQAVTLSSPASTFSQSDQRGVERIRLTVNGTATEHDLDPSFPGTLVLPLAKRTKVRTLAVEVLAPASGRRGFAEIGLR